MDNIEEKLKKLIIERYGTMIDFARVLDIPNSTLQSIMNRGIHKASINNVIKICSALHISTDGLAAGKIIATDDSDDQTTQPHELSEIISHAKMSLLHNEITVDGKPLTADEILDIIEMINLHFEFIKRKRNRN